MKPSTAQFIADLQREVTNLDRDLNDIFLHVCAVRDGRTQWSTKSDNQTVSAIIGEIKKLKK